MKRLALLAILLTAWLCAPAHAQFNGCTSFCGKSSSAVVDGPGFNNAQGSGGGGAVPLTLNGTPQTANATTSALALPAFTAPASNNVVVVAIISNATPSAGHAVTSVTGGGLTFASEPSLTPPSGGGSTMEIWYAVASSPVSAAAFTVNTTTSAFITALVFAVNGAHTAAPFDTGGPTTAVQPAIATVNTSASNTFAFGVMGGSSSVPANGYTNMNATALGNFLLVDYKIVSVPQSAVVFETGTPGPSVTTALVQGP